MNTVTFGDQRLQTPDQFYRSIFPDWQNLSYSYPSPAGVSDDWWGKGTQAVGYDNPPSQGLRPQARSIPKSQITFGDQRLQTPDQFYRSIFPDWQDLSYQYPSPVGGSDSWWGRGQSVRPGGPTAMNRITFGDQLPPPFGQYPSPSGQSDSWWGKGSSSWVDDFLEADPNYRPPYFDPPDPPSQGSRPQARPIPTVDPYPSSAPSYQEAASAARTRQAYAAGMDDYFPGLRPPRRMPKPPDAAGMDDYFPGLRPPRRMPKPSNSTDWMNSGKGIAVQEGLGFGLGALMSGGFALSAGATPNQALGIAGASVAGDAAGSLLGHLAGTAAIPLFGPVAPLAGRMIGGMIGGIAGDRLGWKTTGAEADLNRRYQEQQMQQPMYDPQTGQQYMASPPPPTPQGKLRSEILASAQNPYMPYMMAQLGGYYA